MVPMPGTVFRTDATPAASAEAPPARPSDHGPAELAARPAISPTSPAAPSDVSPDGASAWISPSDDERDEPTPSMFGGLGGFNTLGVAELKPLSAARLEPARVAPGRSSTFGELDAIYPKAPEAVRDEAKSERARAGC